MGPVVVFDTNILISALISLHGNPFRCLALAKEALVESVTCNDILLEFAGKLVKKFGHAPSQANAAAEEVRSISRVVLVSGECEVVASDPDDNMILECASVGGAEYIVTGDHHLLDLRAYQGTEILTAARFLELVKLRR